ncbi:MAG: hypothetical protein OEN50_11895 [Deltaproteobacteria bacterium]|nr:hypothetical protein [Deltaproteobacteria bacterium]
MIKGSAQRLGRSAWLAGSIRIDIPKDDVPLLVRRQEGVKYLDATKPKFMSSRPVIKVVNEALAAAGNK